MCTASPQPRVRQPGKAFTLAFTLVELLVVISIIAVLMGILLPTLARARQSSRNLVETSAARQLLTAYAQYTADNRGKLLPGHLNDNALAVLDNYGKNQITGEPVKRWPWRLMANTKYALKGSLIVGERAEFFDDGQSMSNFNYQYGLSLTPSFGYNMAGLGGDISKINGAWTLTAATAHACTRANQVTQNTNRIVFCSARGYGVDPQMAEGYWRVAPPTANHEYATNGRWSSAHFDGTQEPSAWGYVHPRWRGKAVVAFFDGHCENLTLQDLRDTRRWFEPAAKSGNADWVPPTP